MLVLEFINHESPQAEDWQCSCCQNSRLHLNQSVSLVDTQARKKKLNKEQILTYNTLVLYTLYLN